MTFLAVMAAYAIASAVLGLVLVLIVWEDGRG